MSTPPQKGDQLAVDLAKWVDAGIIDSSQADKIWQLQGTLPPDVSPESSPLPSPTSPGSADRNHGVIPTAATRPTASNSRVPLAAEILGYAGGTLAIGALITLLVMAWGSLDEFSRVAIVGTATVVIWLAGLGLGEHKQPAFRRLGSVLWAVSVVGFAGVGTLLFVDVMDVEEKAAVEAVAGTTLAYSSLLWYFRREAMQHLVTAVAIGATELALLNLPEDSLEVGIYAAVFWVTGLVWMLFTWAGKLRPVELAHFLAVGALLLGAQLAVFENTGLGIAFGIVTATGIALYGLQRRKIELVAFAGIGLLIFLPQASVHWIGDSIGAAMALFAGGLTVVAASVLVARMRSEA